MRVPSKMGSPHTTPPTVLRRANQRNTRRRRVFSFIGHPARPRQSIQRKQPKSSLQLANVPAWENWVTSTVYLGYRKPLAEQTFDRGLRRGQRPAPSIRRSEARIGAWQSVSIDEQRLIHQSLLLPISRQHVGRSIPGQPLHNVLVPATHLAGVSNSRVSLPPLPD